jgi:dicarboxylate/amino acid:cation (Na+ or H+) symporter, DAACS family
MKAWQKLMLGFVAGVVLGLIGYYVLPEKSYPFMKRFTEICTLTGAIFLRLIFMVVVPLIVAGLILGVYELGKGRGLGRVARNCILFTLSLTTIGVGIAIAVANILRPGVGMVFDPVALAQNQGVISISKNVAAAQAKPWYQYFTELLTQNPVDSMAKAFQGEMIPMMIFALIFGAALALTIKDEDHPLIQALEAIFRGSLKVIDWAMKIAPYGIGAIVFNTTYRMGAGFLGNVAYFAGCVVFGLALQQFVVYASFLKFLGKTNPWSFMNKCREVYLYAFTTASSNATLPVALETAETKLMIPPKISRFVLTIGASANQNGTALFEGITVLFLAQAYGINLGLESQLAVVFAAILAGIGTAGVPGGSLPLIAILCIQVGVPPEGMGLILGIDRFLDMCRTTLNVSGDLVIAQLVSSSVTEEEAAAVAAVIPEVSQ